METQNPNQSQDKYTQAQVDEFYDYATYLIAQKNMHPLNAEAMLVKEKGLTAEEAHMVVTNIETDIPTFEEEDRSGGVQDLVLGALFCGGGLILTLTDTGFIFYGAIIYGGIMFFRGLSRL